MTDFRDVALESLKNILNKKQDVFQMDETNEDNAFVMMLMLTALRKLVYIKSISNFVCFCKQ